MKKKLIALIAFFVVIVCMCTGCNRTVKEKDIKADLESYTQNIEIIVCLYLHIIWKSQDLLIIFCHS